jgi:hypothetical protein
VVVVRQSASVPSCSTVELVLPSMPIQWAEYAFSPCVQVTVGTIQLALTALKVAPVSTYPDQFCDCSGGLGGAVVTVRVARFVGTPLGAAELVNTASYSYPLSEEVAVNE